MHKDRPADVEETGAVTQHHSEGLIYSCTSVHHIHTYIHTHIHRETSSNGHKQTSWHGRTRISCWTLFWRYAICTFKKIGSAKTSVYIDIHIYIHRETNPLIRRHRISHWMWSWRSVTWLFYTICILYFMPCTYDPIKLVRRLWLFNLRRSSSYYYLHTGNHNTCPQTRAAWQGSNAVFSSPTREDSLNTMFGALGSNIPTTARFRKYFAWIYIECDVISRLPLGPWNIMCTIKSNTK